MRGEPRAFVKSIDRNRVICIMSLIGRVKVLTEYFMAFAASYEAVLDRRNS